MFTVLIFNVRSNTFLEFTSFLFSLDFSFLFFFFLLFLLLFNFEKKPVMSILSLMLLLYHFDMCMLMYNVD